VANGGTGVFGLREADMTVKGTRARPKLGKLSLRLALTLRAFSDVSSRPVTSLKT
jgi:hypothetical protein